MPIEWVRISETSMGRDRAGNELGDHLGSGPAPAGCSDLDEVLVYRRSSTAGRSRQASAPSSRSSRTSGSSSVGRRFDRARFADEQFHEESVGPCAVGSAFIGAHDTDGPETHRCVSSESRRDCRRPGRSSAVIASVIEEMVRKRAIASVAWPRRCTAGSM